MMKFRHRIGVGWIVLVVLSGLTPGCTKVATLDVQPKQKTIYVLGATVALTPQAMDKSGKPIDNPKILWSSGDEKIVKVSLTGVVTAVTAGKTIVSAVSGKGKADVQVKVLPLSGIKISSESLNLVGPIGSSSQLQAIVTDEKGLTVDEKVKWLSTAPSVATVSAEGVVVSKGTGKGKIVASLEGMKSEIDVRVDVREIVKIEVHPDTTILRLNESQAFSATVYDQGGMAIPNVAVTWKSSAPQIATVDPTGLVRGVTKGTCQVEASFAGKVAQANVIVNPQ